MDFDFKTYSKSSETLNNIRTKNGKENASKFTKLVYFLFYNFKTAVVRFLIWLFVYTLVAMIAGVRNNRSNDRKYPSGKYKKVIKEGFFYDSTEYHEI